MPWAGDWYLWSVFALHYDVAYFAEPMVCYREHELSMTNQLTRTEAAACCDEEISIPWDIKKRADEAQFVRVSRDCLRAVSELYAKCAATNRFGLGSPVMSLKRFEESLCHNCKNEGERNWVRARVFAEMGNELYWQGDVAAARQFYGAALRLRPLMPRVIAKRLLLSLGRPGSYFRGVIRSLASGGGQ
jgi:hypothetical protein